MTLCWEKACCDQGLSRALLVATLGSGRAAVTAYLTQTSVPSCAGIGALAVSMSSAQSSCGPLGSLLRQWATAAISAWQKASDVISLGSISRKYLLLFSAPSDFGYFSVNFSICEGSVTAALQCGISTVKPRILPRFLIKITCF